MTGQTEQQTAPGLLIVDGLPKQDNSQASSGETRHFKELLVTLEREVAQHLSETAAIRADSPRKYPPIGEPVPTLPLPIHERSDELTAVAAKPSRGNRWWIAALATLLLAGGVLAYWQFIESSSVFTPTIVKQAPDPLPNAAAGSNPPNTPPLETANPMPEGLSSTTIPGRVPATPQPAQPAGAETAPVPQVSPAPEQRSPESSAVSATTGARCSEVVQALGLCAPASGNGGK